MKGLKMYCHYCVCEDSWESERGIQTRITYFQKQPMEVFCKLTVLHLPGSLN